jgi:hypothetical protein
MRKRRFASEAWKGSAATKGFDGMRLVTWTS